MIFALPSEIDSFVDWQISAKHLFFDSNSRTRKQRLTKNLSTDSNFSFLIEHTDETLGGRLSQQFLPIPIEYSLIRSALNIIRRIENQDIVREAKRLLLVIQETITTFHYCKFDLGYLPQLKAFQVDDGSILIEWIFDDFRIGFSIEPNLKDSSWYLVSNANLGEISASGYISRIDIKSLVLWLINFVISHS